MQVIIFSYECEILNRELKHGGLLLENGVLNGGIVFFKLSKNKILECRIHYPLSVEQIKHLA